LVESRTFGQARLSWASLFVLWLGTGCIDVTLSWEVDSSEAQQDASDSALNGIPTRFEISAPPATQGVPLTVTVRALDAAGNTASSFAGSVTLVGTGSVSGAGAVTLTSGQGTILISDAVNETVTLSLTYSGTLAMDSAATLSVRFRSPALLSVAGGTGYDFGSVAVGGSGVDTPINVVNSGETEATLSSYAGLTGAFAFVGGSSPGTGGDCGATLAGGSTCRLNVGFNPSTGVWQSVTLTVNYGNGVGATSADATLQGTGVFTGLLSTLALSLKAELRAAL
jgi:hypothetical protein